jgi:cystathionine beta-lyase
MMDFDHVIDRRDTGSAKWKWYGDALPLWVADMDFRAPEPVIDALRQRVDHGIFGYTLPPPELREVIQAWLLERHGWRVPVEAISCLPGVMRAVNMTGRAIGEPGDGILVQPPVYYPFFHVPKNQGRELQYAQVSRVDGRYQIDFDAFEAAISERTRLLLLCNPHNPIGRAYTQAELEQMAEICLRHGVAICSDEIHSDVVYPGYCHTPIASLSPEVAARTVTVLAPSKTFNIPGLACSVMVIENPELRQQVEAAGAGLVGGCNVMGYTAMLAAYRDGAEWLEALLEYLAANRDAVARFVAERMPGIRMDLPEATFLAWLDCREASIPGNPHKFFLDQAGVALNDGATFGPGGEGYVRLNFGCPRATLLEALERMGEALGRL